MGVPKPMRVANSRRNKICDMKENTLELPGSMELSDQEIKTIDGGGLAPGRRG